MASDQQFCLRWNNHQSTLVSVFDNLLESQTLVDCTLAADGQYLKAHKVVLSACSPYLEAILCQNLDKHPILILKDVKFTELKAMLDYMYRGEVNISQEQLSTFLKAAESLQIKGLTDSGGGGGGDLRDKRSDLRKPLTQPVPHIPQPRPVVPHGLLDQRRSLPHFPLHIADMQPQSPQVAREGSTSPTARKRRRPNRPSSDDSNFVSTPNSLSENQPDTSDSCDLPVKQNNSITSNVPNSTKAPETDSPRSTPQPMPQQNLPEQKQVSVKKEFNEAAMLTPKTELDYGNDNSMEDVNYEDDDDEEVDLSKPGPSFSANSQGFPPWQVGGDGSNDDSNNIYSPDVTAANNQNNSQGEELFTFASCGSPVEVDPLGSIDDNENLPNQQRLYTEEGIALEEFRKMFPLHQTFKTISSEVSIRKKRRYPIWSPSKSQLVAWDKGKSAKNLSVFVSKQLKSQSNLSSGNEKRRPGRPRVNFPTSRPSQQNTSQVKRSRGRPRLYFPTSSGISTKPSIMNKNQGLSKSAKNISSPRSSSDLAKSKTASRRSCTSLPVGFYREETLQLIKEHVSHENSFQEKRHLRMLRMKQDFGGHRELRRSREISPERTRRTRSLRSRSEIELINIDDDEDSDSDQESSESENNNTIPSRKENPMAQKWNSCYINLEKLDLGSSGLNENRRSKIASNYHLKEVKVELEDISHNHPSVSTNRAKTVDKKTKIRSQRKQSDHENAWNRLTKIKEEPPTDDFEEILRTTRSGTRK